jgi:hypothetical protein
MKVKAWLVVAGMAASGVAAAASWDGPKVDYSADSYMETAEGVMKGRVYASPGKERREYDQDGEKMTMIMRQDKKVGWMLMSGEKMYMEVDLSKSGKRKDNLSGYTIEQTTIGPETVNGVKTTKSKIIMTGPKGEKMGGFWWVTKDNIIVKMDAISVIKGSKDRFKIELQNLKVARQDPSLFEVPAGYSKMGMDMGSIGKMMGGGRGEGDGEKPRKSKDKEGGGGFGLKDALDLLK